MFSNKFIKATENYCTYEKHVNAPLFRKIFEVKDNKNGEIIICGLGFYRLFINGKEITKSYLSPYISNLNHIVYYDKYDLSNELKIGKNVIGVILGNGMLNCMGGHTWDFEKADYRDAPKLAFKLKIDGYEIEAYGEILVHIL